MAFNEFGLNEYEFFSMPPFRTYLMQRHVVRNRERQWEQTRYLAAMIHNTSMSTKRKMRGEQLIKLSFDEDKKEKYQWTQEEAEQLVRAWAPDLAEDLFNKKN